MAFVLRDYQQEMVDAARVALRTHKAIICQLATGGGKTGLSTQMLKSVAAKRVAGAFVVHRQELIDQTERTFNEFDIPFGIISAGYPTNPLQPIQICSIDTLRARLLRGMKLPPFRFMVWDECHHIAAAGWKAVKARFFNAQHVGLTATPERLDGKGLDDEFSHMVQGPTIAELIARGFLSPYRPFIPSTPDLSGLHTMAGDFDKRDNEAVMDKPSITGDAISHYLKHARDRRALAFCTSVKHSQNVVQQFKDVGVVAWHVDGKTDRGERRAAIAAFRRGEIKVLSNVDLFGEGFDVPAADCSIMLRPTKSLALFLQQCGRVLRAVPGKPPAILLDHAGNMIRHGLPDDEREWSLKGRDKKARDAAEVGVKQCPKCYFAHRVGKPACPNCGFKYEVIGREVEQRDGVLVERDIQAERAAKAREQGAVIAEALKGTLEMEPEDRNAKVLKSLIELGRKRGYKNPEGWAAHYWTARGGFKANRKEL